MRKERGFTLIELLVALLVVGVLSAIALPSLLSYRNKAEVAKAEDIAASFVVPLLQQQLQDGEFPPDTLQNEVPLGLEIYWVDAIAAPFGSSFDYDHHNLGNGICLAQITWFGQNRQRNTSAYEQVAQGDDRIIPVAVYSCQGSRGRM